MLRFYRTASLSLIITLLVNSVHAQSYRLWGTTNGTYNGSPDGYGSVFTINADGSDVKKAHAFNGTDGSALNSGVIQASDGFLYGTIRYGGVNDKGAIFKINPDGSGFLKIHDFDGTNGQDPQPGLIQASDGALYGMTTLGGANSAGTIFKINLDGTGFAKLLDLNVTLTGSSPRASFLQASDGFLYATTFQGGTNDRGTLFKIKTDGTSFLKLKDFGGVDGERPNGTLIQATDGDLYGTASSGGASSNGTIFKIKLDGTFTKLFDFNNSNGSAPLCTLVESADGYLYGTTFGGGGAVIIGQGTFYYGSLFRIKPDGTQFLTIHDFGYPADGTFPDGGLVQLPDGTLVGITLMGGANDKGTIFKVATDGTYSKVYDFDSSIGSQPRYKLTLINKVSQAISFSLPQKSVGDPAFTLNGTATSGLPITYSSSNTSVATISGNMATPIAAGSSQLTASQSGNSYYLPAPAIIQTLTVSGTPPASSDMFGIASGGANSKYAIYKIKTDGTGFAKLFDFNGTNGYSNNPQNSLIQLSDGFLAGMTQYGGASDYGVLYKIKTDGTGYVKLLDFNDTNGRYPYGNVVQASNGYLYGMTYMGGTHGFGLIFRINIDGTNYIKLFDFDLANTGGFPQGSFLETSDGFLYGMTPTGGAHSEGTLFKIKLDGTSFTKILDFDGANLGATPNGTLIQASNGNLYGLTWGGGTHLKGTIFKMNHDGTGFSKLVDLDGANTGSGPYGQLLESNGKLYGLAENGGSLNYGTAFSIAFDGTGFTKLLDLDNTNNGRFPYGSFIQDANGTLYGTTWSGGTSTNGTVFKLSGTNYTKLHDFNLSADGIWLPNGNLLLGKQNQTITFGSLGSRNINDSFALAATSSSGLPLTYTSSNTAVATISGTMITVVGNGTATITASQVGNQFYFPASATQLLTIASSTKSDQTITFPPLPSKTFGDTPFTLAAGATSGLTITYVSSNSSVATVVGNTVTIVGVGTSIITARQSGNLSYFAATDVQQTLTVAKANQTITFGSISSKKFGDVAFVLPGSSSSGLPISFTSSDLSIAKISGNVVTITGAGTCTITASQNGNSNYNSATQVTQTLTVAKANQTISFSVIPDKILGDAPFSLKASASSGLPISFSSSNILVATVSGNIITITGGGVTTIEAAQTGNANYNSASSTHTMLVRLDQTITFDSISTKNFGDAPFTLNASATSGLAVSFSSSNSSVATISGNTVTIKGGGTAKITAAQPGNFVYASAPVATRWLVVNKVNQSITFNPIPDKTMGDQPFNLSATCTSGLSVQFTTKSNKVSISGSKVTLIQPGSVTIIAEQPGNNGFNVAPTVPQVFCVNPAKPSIISSRSNQGLVFSSSSPAGNQWYLNNVPLPGAINQSFQPLGDGIYSVRVTVDNCVSDLAVIPLVTTEVGKGVSDFLIYPNPVKNSVEINSGVIDVNEKIEIVIYDSNGKTIDQFNLQGVSSIPVESYSSGKYILKAAQSDRVFVGQFIKE